MTWNAAKQAELPLDAKPSDPKRSLTLSQREQLYAALRHDRMGAYFVLLGELGLRPQEADALRWTEVDLDSGVISILRARKRTDGGQPVGTGTPKTVGSRRKLRLTSIAASALTERWTKQAAERRAAGEAWSVDERWKDLVFTTEVGTPIHPSNARRALRAAIRRVNARVSEADVADLIAPDFTPYEVGRHTTASLAVEAGASPYQVADLLGHTSTSRGSDLVVLGWAIRASIP